MARLIQFFIKHSVLGNVLMLLILFFGYQGLRSMRSTFFPNTPEKFIIVQVAYPGASPEQIEEGIVLKIEENLKGMTGVDRVSSVSRENAATITVEILTGYDINIVKQDVENAVSRISSFPVGMESPQIFKQENRNFAYSFALSGDVPLLTLKDKARQVEDELRATGFISKIQVSGFPSEEIEIAFREDDLRKYQMTFAEALAAVRNSNLELTGGRLKGSQEELLLRARNKGYFAEDLKNIVLKTTESGSVLRLFQIADIQDQWEDNPQRSYLNGKASVVLTIQNTDDEDILQIADYCREYVENFNSRGDVVKATTIRDGSVNLRQRIDLLTKNGLQGILLVLLCLGLFLHWRLAFWVAAAIPISFAGLYMIAPLLGLTINVVSLFGMIVVIGILVDDGIVISENIYARYEKGEAPLEAAYKGTIQVAGPVFSAISTTVIAFSAFFFIDGRLGEIFSDLALVVVITLIVSLFEGLFILPAHIGHSKALDHKAKPNLFMRGLDAFMKFLRERLFAPVLRFCLDGWNRLLPIAIFVGLLILTFGAISGGKIRTTFFPFIERDDIEVTLNMPAGTREQITLQWLSHIEKAAWEVNEELSAQRTDGLQMVEKVEKNILAASYQGTMSIALLDGERRGMGILEVTEMIRQKVGPIPGAENVSFGTRSIFGKPVSVSILSNDLRLLGQATEALKAELLQIEGLKDILDNNQEGLREINISLNAKGEQLGLNLQEVVNQVRLGFFGGEVQRLQRGRDEVRVWVRYALDNRNSAGQLENMRLRFADGREYPLSEIANFEVQRGVIAINHIDGKREVKVEADIADRRTSVTDITARIRTEIAPRLAAEFPGVQFLFEGQNKENEKSMKSMMFVVPLILLLMITAITFTFRSIGQAIAVVAIIPFGFIGVGFGHYWLDAPISFFSVLGIVALIGIIVNDSIVFVEAYNDFLRAGYTQTEAAYQAGIARFRAILLTSLTTILGLAPLILEKSFQAQFLVPMAISVAFGLFVGTFLTLILLPVVLILMNRYKTWVSRLWTGEAISYEEVEPAVEGRRNDFLIWFGGIVILIVLWRLLMMLLA